MLALWCVTTLDVCWHPTTLDCTTCKPHPQLQCLRSGKGRPSMVPTTLPFDLSLGGQQQQQLTETAHTPNLALLLYVHIVMWYSIEHTTQPRAGQLATPDSASTQHATYVDKMHQWFTHAQCMLPRSHAIWMLAMNYCMYVRMSVRT